MTLRVLDLFCKAGGAAVGYARAGFEVVGVDIERQPRYPFFVHQGDAFTLGAELLAEEQFDLVHASPPCQAYSSLRHLHPAKTYPAMIEQTREFLQSTGLPYVIEGVVGSPLLNPLMLCGSEFGLGASGFTLRRHRLFESNMTMRSAGGCSCSHYEVAGMSGHPPARTTKYKGWQFGFADACTAMEIDWMSARELGQAIPPAYTEHIGTRIYRDISLGRQAMATA